MLGSLLLTAQLTLAGASGALQCERLPQLFEDFEQSHYSVHKLTPELEKRTVEQFVKALDPSRTLLTEADVTALKKDLPEAFQSMKAGDCGVLDHAMNLLISRAEADERLAAGMLNESYKLDDTVELNIDPEKRGYPKTPDERSALVRKMIHFQMSNFLVSGLTLPAAKKQLLHRYQLFSKRLKERETKGELPEMFAEAFATALDPHSSFMGAEAFTDFQIQMQLSLEGIGAALSSQDGFTVVESLVPGGQAEKSNLLRPKDKIIAVSQENGKPVSTIDMDLQDVVKMIRGKKGTKVTLTVLREGPSTKNFDATIVRDTIDVKEQAAKITYEMRRVGNKTIKVGIIDLPSFYGGGSAGSRSSYTDVKRLLGEAHNEKVDGLVIDLSRNGGGLLQDAVKIAGLFIKDGGVVATKDSTGAVEVLEDQDPDTEFTGPLALLISRASASASEILAGALKDYHRALIVGSDHTFGKGTVQVLAPLRREELATLRATGKREELGAMKVTTGMFFLPGGFSTQQKGVASDVRVPSLLDSYDLCENKLDYSLPPQSTRPFVSSEANASDPAKHWLPIDGSKLATLQKRSEERVAKDPEMIELKKQNEDNEKNKGIVRLSDLRKKAKGSDKKDVVKEALDEKEKSKFKDMQAAFVREGVNVLIDFITTST